MRTRVRTQDIISRLTHAPPATGMNWNTKKAAVTQAKQAP